MDETNKPAVAPAPENQKTIILPISKITVNFKTRLTWNEKNAVEGVMVAATKGVIVDGRVEQTIDGSATTAFFRKMIETFITSATKDGKPFQINIELGNLDSEDGDFLQATVNELWENIKKKSVPTMS